MIAWGEWRQVKATWAAGFARWLSTHTGQLPTNMLSTFKTLSDAMVAANTPDEWSRFWTQAIAALAPGLQQLELLIKAHALKGDVLAAKERVQGASWEVRRDALANMLEESALAMALSEDSTNLPLFKALVARLRTLSDPDQLDRFNKKMTELQLKMFVELSHFEFN